LKKFEGKIEQNRKKLFLNNNATGKMSLKRKIKNLGKFQGLLKQRQNTTAQKQAVLGKSFDNLDTCTIPKSFYATVCTASIRLHIYTCIDFQLNLNSTVYNEIVSNH
jgi:hypothetical protein